MRVPNWLVVIGAVAAAFPFGWGVGVVTAYALAGREFGQLPVLTVPLGILAAVVFALWPTVKATTRLKTLLGGTLIFVLLAWLSR